MANENKNYSIRLYGSLRQSLQTMAKEEKRLLSNKIIVILEKAVEKWYKEKEESKGVSNEE